MSTSRRVPKYGLLVWLMMIMGSIQGCTIHESTPFVESSDPPPVYSTQFVLTATPTTNEPIDFPLQDKDQQLDKLGLKPTSPPYPTPTFAPGLAPSMDPIDVHFIGHGDREKNLVALTFDLCQDPSNPSGFDEEIFDALVDAGAPATFFLGGDWMRTHIEQTRKLAGIQKFELGNHSWSHKDFRELEELEMSREVLRTQTMLYKLTGQQPRLFRFPAGTYNALAQSVVAWHGLRSVQWDVVIADPVPDNTAELINARVREQVKNGSILIMHANGRGWHTAEALPEMISYLRGEGYCLVTVSQMLGLEPLPAGCDRNN